MRARRYQLRKEAVGVVERGHPWIFREQMSSAADVFTDGDWLRLVDGANRIIGHGIYEAEGAIAIRILRRGPDRPDAAYFRAQLAAAIHRRAPLAPRTTGIRLLHGESDGIPAVVVDRFADTLVIASYSAGTDGLARYIARVLGQPRTLPAPAPHALRSDPSAPAAPATFGPPPIPFAAPTAPFPLSIAPAPPPMTHPVAPIGLGPSLAAPFAPHPAPSIGPSPRAPGIPSPIGPSPGAPFMPIAPGPSGPPPIAPHVTMPTAVPGAPLVPPAFTPPTIPVMMPVGPPPIALPGLPVVVMPSVGPPSMPPPRAVPEAAVPVETIIGPCSRILLRPARRRRGPALPARWLRGAPTEIVTFVEDGAAFAVDLESGQKTGTYLDLRGLRRAIATAPLAGARVLNLFAYTGMLGRAAEAAGAASIVQVDASEAALAVALARHVTDPARHTFVAADVFDWLPAHAPDALYDVVIVDPPSMTSRRAQVPSVIAAYRRLYGAARRLVRPGGTIVAACCTSRVERAEFHRAVRDALGGGFTLERELPAEIDHPVGFPQADYLKIAFWRATLSPAATTAGPTSGERSRGT